MTDYSNGDKPTPLDVEGGLPSSEPAKPKAAGKADGSVPTFDRASMVGSEFLHNAWHAVIQCTHRATRRSAERPWCGFWLMNIVCTHNFG